MIVALVGHHPANKLIIRMPSRHRHGFPRGRMPSPGLRGINPAFAGLSPCGGQVAYVLRTRAPVAASVLLHRAAPRLACVRPAASVHPEPGSNSSLYSNSSRGCPPALSRRTLPFLRRASTARPVCCTSNFNDLSSLHPGVSPGKRMQRYALFPSQAKLFRMFFHRGCHFFCNTLWISGERGRFFWRERAFLGVRGASTARRKGGCRVGFTARMAGFCGGGGRGGLRQASLRDSARVRVFNSISHTADGETGAGLRCLFGCSPWGIRRGYVFLTFIWGLDAEGEMAYPMMPRITPKRSLDRGFGVRQRSNFF